MKTCESIMETKQQYDIYTYRAVGLRVGEYDGSGVVGSFDIDGE